MSLLILKLILTPLLIAAVTLASRRWGAGVGGWLAGLPLTSGPVSLFLALQYGNDFAARASIGTLVGVAAVAVFCAIYFVTAPHANWLLTLAVALSTYVAAANTIRFAVVLPQLVAFLIVIVALALLVLVIRLVPNRRERITATSKEHPRWELPSRMVVATALVFGLTAAARSVRPELIGLIAHFPVFAGVLTVFAHRSHGYQAAQMVARGVLHGSFGFAIFFLIIGTLLIYLDVWCTFAIATIAAVATNLSMLGLQRQS